MSRNLKIIIVLKLILWFIIIYFSYNIYSWFKDNYNTDKLISTINNKTKDNNIENIISINSDIKGWIKVDNTNISYPFVQTNDNEYYLYHSIDKSKNKAGWIFLDYRNDLDNDKNIIIYGHNRINDTMFGSLNNLSKYNNINYIYIYTTNYISTYEIFSIYHIDKTDDYLSTNYDNNLIDIITNRSIYNFNNKPNENDYLITLSTCYNNNERFVVHGKLIKKEGI